MRLELNFLFVWGFISIWLLSNLAKLTTFTLYIQCHHISIYLPPSKWRIIILFGYFPEGPSLFWVCLPELQVGRWVQGRNSTSTPTLKGEVGGIQRAALQAGVSVVSTSVIVGRTGGVTVKSWPVVTRRDFWWYLAQFSNNIICNVRDICKRRCHGRTGTVLCYEHSYLWSP